MNTDHKRIHLFFLWFAVLLWGIIWLGINGVSVQAATKKPAKPPAPTIRVAEDGTIIADLPKSVVNKVDGYAVYASKNISGGYEMVGQQMVSYCYTVEEASSCRLWLNSDIPGTYYFKVRTFNMTSSWKEKYSSYSEATAFEWLWSLKTKSAGSNQVNLITNEVRGPIGTVVENRTPQEYEIYRSTSADGTFTLLASYDSSEFSGRNDHAYTDQQVTLGNTYYYKVRALFYDENAYDHYQYPYDYDEDYYDGESYNRQQNNGDAGVNVINTKPQPIYAFDTNIAEGHPGPLSTTSLTSKAQKNNKLKLSWKGVNGVSGYYLYQVGQDGRKQIAKTSKTSYTWKKREHSVNYQVVVVPYIKVDGKEITGADSEIFSALMNYYTSPYDDKITRFFGKNASKKFAKYEDSRHSGKTYYSSESEARKQMKTIVIKVWDFKNGKSGKKITRTFHLTVHKKVAPSLKKAFDEIYKGKEKFPIHDIGGYSYRWGQHGVGLAVDINPNENAQFVNGKAAVGSFYKPGKNPFPPMEKLPEF